jgi:hypothetical protein
MKSSASQGEAQDGKLRRQVALKFLPEELSREAQMLERFEREAQAASPLLRPQPNMIPGQRPKSTFAI